MHITSLPLPIISTNQLAALGSQTGASAVEVGGHNHYTVTFRYVGSSSILILVFQFLYQTFSSASPCPDILPCPFNGSQDRHALQSQSVSTSPPPPLCIRSSISACLTPHWFSTHVPIVAHSTPIGVTHLQQIHTQALAENRTHLQQSARTLQLHRSHILNPSHSTRVSCRHLHITP